MAATKRAVDMSNVKDPGSFRPKHKPEGDYRAKVVKVEDHKSKAGNDQWVFTLQLTSDQRATYPYYCGFAEKEAWKIRNLLIAAGISVPKKRVNVDPNKLVGKEVGITLEDDEYDGKMKSTIAATFPVSDLASDAPSGAEEDDDTPEPDTDDEVSDDDMDELDLDEL